MFERITFTYQQRRYNNKHSKYNEYKANNGNDNNNKYTNNDNDTNYINNNTYYFHVLPDNNKYNTFNTNKYKK